MSETVRVSTDSIVMCFLVCHRHHMQQRERALKAVLNLVLDEKRENSETMDRDMLSHRVAIQTAALLWRIFTKDATLRSQMIAIEARIDSGRLNAGNAVLPFASNPLTDDSL